MPSSGSLLTVLQKVRVALGDLNRQIRRLLPELELKQGVLLRLLAREQELKESLLRRLLRHSDGRYGWSIVSVPT